jgi:hypothetical protein
MATATNTKASQTVFSPSGSATVKAKASNDGMNSFLKIFFSCFFGLLFHLIPPVCL